ncbi:hypothetical protein ADIMK_3114 [Marinobacterium lacunae]|uniref:Ribosomal subunit interface protein n=1 Tax=Marinobacterium lacunae TaxID=1232683 RepID=A0A081FVT7_9GAMM|nr:HPF/RaiA family ribosome-associated protein [Marinobacterium lacunae]KEA62642.1 hypothetical protein ADIMK_3114 [Marinobacterium lacunae]MBR9883282.1 hypothetical protein [Oceanospirillales bacterium]
MITAVMFRHGIENPEAMERIRSRLQRLESRSERIRRVDVVLDKVSYAGEPSLNYQCHISFRGTEKRDLDIYADKRQADMAIDDAFDRLNTALKSGLIRRMRKRR